MSKKKKSSTNVTAYKKLEYKIAAKSRRERRIMWIVACAVGVVLVGVIAGIIIYNMIQDGLADREGREYVDYIDEGREEIEQNERVVATCNGFEIPYEALRFHTVLQKSILEAEYGDGIWEDEATAEEHRAELEAAVVKSLQNDYMVLSACRQLSINTDQEEVVTLVNQKMKALWDQVELEYDNQLNDAADYASAKEMFIANLEELGMSENQMRTYYKIQDCLPQLIFYTLEEFGHFTYVVSNLEDFQKYVFADTNGDANFLRTVQVMTEDRETAQSIYEDLMSIADPTERLNRMYDYIGSKDNKDVGMPSKNGYYFTRGEMLEDYETTAYALAYGEVSAPLEVSGQWCVMMRLELEEDYVTTNIATLLKQYQNTVMDRYVEGYRKDCDISYTVYGKGLDLVAIH